MRRITIRISLTGVMVLWGFLFLLLTGAHADAQQKNSNEAIFLTYHFLAYPSLTHLCQQRVYLAGQGAMHLTWDAFASEDTTSAIVDHYTKLLGNGGFSPERQGGTWRFPKDKPVRVLSIIPVDAEGPHWSCRKSPPASAKSIIIISTTY